jgi:glycyl-tRNA synthetase alpha chain
MGTKTSTYTLGFHELALHLFKMLDARGAISVTERVALEARVRKVACEVAAICLGRPTALEVLR